MHLLGTFGQEVLPWSSGRVTRATQISIFLSLLRHFFIETGNGTSSESLNDTEESVVSLHHSSILSGSRSPSMGMSPSLKMAVANHAEDEGRSNTTSHCDPSPLLQSHDED